MKKEFFTRPFGGRLALLSLSSSSAGEPILRLTFRKTIAKEMKEKGFQWAQVLPLFPDTLFLSLSSFPFSQNSRYIAYIKNCQRAEIVLPFSLKRASFPFEKRLGKVGWKNSHEMIVRFGLEEEEKRRLNEVLLRKEIRKILKGERKEEDRCKLEIYFRKKEKDKISKCQITFSLHLTEKLKSLKVKGAQIVLIRKNILLFFLERNCSLSCQQCTRVFCFPFREKRGRISVGARRIFLSKMALSPENLKNLSEKQKEGKIYFSKNQKDFFLLYFPHL